MKNLVLISVVLSVLFVSCQNEVIEPIVSNDKMDEVVILIPLTAKLITEKSVVAYEEGEVLDAANFAQLLANAITDKSVRSFIKDESNKKFDGDYNFLVNKSMNAKIGALTFKEKISQLNVNGNLKSASVLYAALENEKLHVSIPVLIDKWDVSKHELLVAVAVGAIEDETEYLFAYDSKGRIYQIDATIEPDVPVIVIANNERLGLDFESNPIEKSNRISGRRERVKFIKCPDLNEIESWFYGGPEIRFHAVVYLDGGGTTAVLAANKTVTPSRAQAESGFFLYQDLFHWHFDDNHGPDYYLQSSEIDDSGTTYKFTVGVTAGKKDVLSGSASFDITYKKQDKVLAGELIHYSNFSPSNIYDSYIQYVVYNE